jgi:glycosyltransferase involved in cell wall biosynthesis
MNPPQRDLALVIPAYMAASVIGQTLASIAQNTDQPAQVLVVDDGSFDGAKEVCARWSSILPLTFIQLAQNAGVSAARNAGLEHVTSRFVSFLDADDLIGPDHIRLVCDAAEAAGSAVISPNAWYWHPDGSTTDYSSRFRRQSVPESDQLRKLTERNFVFIAAVVPTEWVRRLRGFRGFPADTASIPEAGSRGLSEDWDLWLRLVAEGLPVVGLKEHTVWYRVRSGSLNDDEERMIGAGIRMLKVFAIEYPKHHSMTKRPIKRLQQRQGVAVLQATLTNDQRRARLSEVIKHSHFHDLRSVIRLSALFALPVRISTRLFGHRGAW